MVFIIEISKLVKPVLFKEPWCWCTDNSHPCDRSTTDLRPPVHVVEHWVSLVILNTLIRGLSMATWNVDILWRAQVCSGPEEAWSIQGDHMTQQAVDIVVEAMSSVCFWIVFCLKRELFVTHRQKSGLCQRQDILCNYTKNKYKHSSFILCKVSKLEWMKKWSDLHTGNTSKRIHNSTGPLMIEQW